MYYIIFMHSTCAIHHVFLFQWPLFRLTQLQKYDSQLRKLYKQEVIDTVIKYER
uniref:SARAH domain-containing protein n=1 Tax=Parascaris equorum TaxID=6256 RepID=A0A914S2V5_PAREQ